MDMTIPPQTVDIPQNTDKADLMSQNQARSPQSTTIDWSDVEGCTSFIRRAGWQRRPIPGELAQLSADIKLSEKAQQIVQWSLMPGSQWAPVPQISDQGVQRETTRRSSIVESLATQHDSSGLSTLSGATTNECNQLDSAGALPHAPNRDTLESDTHSYDGYKTTRRSNILARLKQRKTLARGPDLAQTPPVLAECTSCFEELPESRLTQLSACRHFYCRTCLTALVTIAMANESSFPPKCCLSPVPLQTVLLHLTTEQRDVYTLKSREYAIPPAERLYCPNTSCLKWISPSKVKYSRGANYRCPHCSEVFCRSCRGPVHKSGSECPQDYGLEATLATAEVEGWQRCYQCRAIVEHTSGCRHMTCKCRAEFCYVCGARWSTCHCTEEHAQSKRDGARRRRVERDQAAHEEARELERVLAEVEEFERREAEARLQEEEQRRREEEELLAALEAERQLEEAARRAAREQAEREWLQALQVSLQDSVAELTDTMDTVTAYQRKTLHARHESDSRRRISEFAQKQSHIRDELASLSEKAATRYAELEAEQAAQQKQELDDMTTKHEEEEDDMFVQVQVRLRGKSNREARMERMMEELRRTQEEQRQELVSTQEKSSQLLQLRKTVDTEGVERALTAELETLQSKHRTGMQRLGFDIGADRQYFELVTQRRLAMVARHEAIAREEVNRKTDPRGLQDWHAAQCNPSLPEQDDGAPGPSMVRWSAEATRPMKPIPTVSITPYPIEPSLPGSFPTEAAMPQSKTFAQMPLTPPLSGSPELYALPHNLASQIPAQARITPRSSFSSDEHPPPRFYATNNVGSHNISPVPIVRTPSPPVRETTGKQRADSTHSSSGSVGANAVPIKRSRWPFGRRSKDLTPEELRERMKRTVGDALNAF